MVKIELAEDDRLSDYCNLWNRVWPDHELTLDEVLRDRRVLPPEQQITVWIADSAGEPVGFSTAYRYVGEYHPKKWNIAVGVVDSSRGKGVGRSLYESANAFIEDQGPISIATRASDQDVASIRFACNRGFVEHKRDFESELRLEDFEPELHEPSIASDIEILPASRLDTPAWRRQFHSLFERLRVDVPRVEPPVRLEFERFQELVLDDPHFSWELTRVATIRGEMVGFSGVFTMGEVGLLEQWLTAVDRSCRGKKIARALKVEVSRHAKEMGFKRIRTKNDSRNAPMLAINEQMGYLRLPGMITFVKRFGA